MKKTAGSLIGLFTCALLIPGSLPQSGSNAIMVQNGLDLARAHETVVIAARDIRKLLKVTDWKILQVTEAGTGTELLRQSVDMEGDGAMDRFLFQADFKAGETRSFLVKLGESQVPARDQFKAYCRFVRERYDDFAWDNDRIAHRMYGKALETWQAEPLRSSTVDVWTKRVRRLVINDWYMVDDHHDDHGEGADFYSTGTSRGCGGSGIWDNGKPVVSRNFIDSKVIANGPIRVIFEPTYAPWVVNGRPISEVKRITLDASQNFDRFESYYKSLPDKPITYGIGIKNFGAASVQSNRQEGWLRTWEPLQKGKAGNLGCAILIDPGLRVDVTEADGNSLVIAKAPSDLPAVYYAGFGWDRSGDFANMADWDAYLRQFAYRLRAPLKISISPH